MPIDAIVMPSWQADEVLVDVVDLDARERGAAQALLDHQVDLLVARAHQRELGRDEEAVRRDEHGYADQEQQLGHGGPSRAGRPVRAVLLRGGSSLIR